MAPPTVEACGRAASAPLWHAGANRGLSCASTVVGSPCEGSERCTGDSGSEDEAGPAVRHGSWGVHTQEPEDDEELWRIFAFDEEVRASEPGASEGEEEEDTEEREGERGPPAAWRADGPRGLRLNGLRLVDLFFAEA
mmetsp:Transcript_98702/g.318279  ORF Transcript_98702/g.318279 Transcript_98702/m.318279 type:complete len:138 (+) Transcript_98702:95-508(+)